MLTQLLNYVSKEEIKYLGYLIGATGQVTTRLCQDPEEPVPVCQPIFLNIDDNIYAWLL